MHKRDLCRRTVSVCLSVTFMYSVETRLITPFYSYPHQIAIFRREPPNWCKNRDFRPISGFGIDDWSSVINSFDRRVKFIVADADDNRHASVNVVYDSKARRRF